jgi:hypothetical protein
VIGEWTNTFASDYKEVSRIIDAKALRMNAYRVLLTRGRDGCIVFIPSIPGKKHMNIFKVAVLTN